MNDFERAQQVERGDSLFKDAIEDCNSGAFTKGFEKAVDALEIFRSVNEKKRIAKTCRLLKGIDKQASFDVGDELKRRGINFGKVCPKSDAEITRMIGAPFADSNSQP